MPPGSTTLPWYFCNFGSKSHISINVAKWTLFCLFVLPELPPFLLLTFPKFHAWIVSSFFHSLSTAAFNIRNFHRLWHRDELVYQVVMRHRCKSFACNVILMIFLVLRRLHSLPCDSWDSTTQPYTVLEFFSDAIFGFAVTFVMLMVFYTAWLLP